MTYSELEAILDEIQIKPGMGTFDRLRWISKENTILAIVERLQGYKLTLNLMLSILQCDETQRAKQSTERLAESVAKLTESHEKLTASIESLQREGSIPSNERDTDVDTIRTPHSAFSSPTTIKPSNDSDDILIGDDDRVETTVETSMEGGENAGASGTDLPYSYLKAISTLAFEEDLNTSSVYSATRTVSIQ
ncbi:MAG: hypothetical protein M1820_003704 [Bogoriella megaspora]|nr:MAG: hypothetical protein M1820_003704 [Bogoriella megaspora]